jgi:DNA polymerase (family X)
MISLASDAHVPGGLEAMTFAVSQARRAWLEPRHILNCMSLEDFEAWLRR